jgi:hypothetical protein
MCGPGACVAPVTISESSTSVRKRAIGAIGVVRTICCTEAARAMGAGGMAVPAPAAAAAAESGTAHACACLCVGAIWHLRTTWNVEFHNARPTNKARKDDFFCCEDGRFFLFFFGQCGHFVLCGSFAFLSPRECESFLVSSSCFFTDLSKPKQVRMQLCIHAHGSDDGDGDGNDGGRVGIHARLASPRSPRSPRGGHTSFKDSLR